MANARTGGGLKSLRTLLNAGAIAGLTDGQLLDRFVGRHDEAAEHAFAVLVERYGPMVFRVCRGILRDSHDAQDAFQATFLILAKRAGSIRTRESVGSWLHGVACRVASAAKAASARRRAYEQRSDLLRAEPPAADPDDFAPVLHDEIARLPAKYRVPIVVCYLEGLTHEQAAARLRWPLGTVRSRLARGRDRLRARLIRRGVVPSTTLLAGAMFSGTASGAIPATLMESTIRAALEFATGQMLTSAADVVSVLAERVLWRLSMSWKMTTLVLLVLAVGAAHGQIGHRANDGTAHTKPRLNPQVVGQAEPTAIEVPARTVYNPDTLSKIRPRFDARVVKVHVTLGQKVHKGDPLVVLQSTELARAKSDLVTKHVQWQHDKKLLAQRRKLRESGAISQQRLIDSQNDEKRSRLDFSLARDKLVVMKVPDQDIERLIRDKNGDGKPSGVGEDEARLTLTAPVDGIVIERDAMPQNHYKPSDVLMVIVALDPLWVVAELPEKNRSMVKVGQTVEVELPFQRPRIKGRIEYVSSEVSKDSRKVKIRASIPNSEFQLKGDLPCQMRIVAPSPKNQKI